MTVVKAKRKGRERDKIRMTEIVNYMKYVEILFFWERRIEEQSRIA